MPAWRALALLVALTSCSLFNLFSATAVDSTDCSPLLTLYRDADGDGYGVTTNTRLGCGPSPGWAAASGDCNDTPVTGSAFHPLAAERCDRVDSDCSNGGGVEPSEDADNDNHAAETAACEGGFARDDCGDNRDDVHPGRSELCDNRDNDCNGQIDEAPVADRACLRENVSIAVCRSGACILTCERDRGDCDHDPRNGCERHLTDDFEHCGACGMRCGAGTVCNDGLCAGRILSVAVGRVAGNDLGGGALSHTCAVRASSSAGGAGPLFCWGTNVTGQLGRRSAQLPGTRVPTVVPLGYPTVAVAAGATSTCAIIAVGVSRRILCWGAPGIDMLFVPPHVIGDMANASQIVMTQGFDQRDAACARTSEGELYCWGSNVSGNLGVGTTELVDVPRRVEVPGRVDDVAMGPAHTCARTSEAVYCWGRNREGQLGDGTTVNRLTPVIALRQTDAGRIAQLAVGDAFSCASASADSPTPELRCWGRNQRNWFGASTTGSPPSAPERFISPVRVPTRGSTSALLAAGDNLWCTGMSETVSMAGDLEVHVNDVLCAGSLFYRQAEGTVEYREFQDIAPVPALRRIRALAAGPEHACGIQDDNKVLCWGENAAGQCGDGSSSRRRTPGIVTALNARVRIAGATGDFLVVGADGAVGSRRGPLRAPFVDRVVRDVAFDRNGHACFIDPTGALFLTTFPLFSPSPPQRLALTSPALRVAFATDESDPSLPVSVACVLTRGGGVDCFRLRREVSSGSVTAGRSWSSPIADDLVDIAGSPRGTRFCGWTARGEGRCWGARAEPTIEALPLASNDVVSIALETLSDCWLRSNGHVSCWSSRGAGAIWQAPDIDDGIQIASGAEHTCVLRRTGRVACWGSNGFGQLGDGTSFDRTDPVEVRGLEDAEEIFTGAEYTCARRETGQVVCWGRNDGGQLDDGTLTDRYVPTPTLQVP